MKKGFFFKTKNLDKLEDSSTMLPNIIHFKQTFLYSFVKNVFWKVFYALVNSFFIVALYCPNLKIISMEIGITNKDKLIINLYVFSTIKIRSVCQSLMAEKSCLCMTCCLSNTCDLWVGNSSNLFVKTG